MGHFEGVKGERIWSVSIHLHVFVWIFLSYMFGGGGGVLPFLFIFFAVNILQTRQHSQLLAEYLDMLADCQHK